MTADTGTKLLPELLHSTFMVSNTLIYIVLRPMLRFLTVPYETVVPEHTRYALFQLYCDLRANPPRDRHWFLIHARRLQPHTFSGWIALGSALLYLSSGAALLLTTLLSFAVVALYTFVFATISIGVVSGFMLGLLAFSLFVTSGAAFFGATGAACGYATLAAAKASLRMLPFGGGRADASGTPGLPEAPRLRPVATPRAPVNTPAIAPQPPATVLPPDTAPASPARRQPTPTAEAFQRAELSAAAPPPPSEAAAPRLAGRAASPLPPSTAPSAAKANGVDSSHTAKPAEPDAQGGAPARASDAASGVAAAHLASGAPSAKQDEGPAAGASEALEGGTSKGSASPNAGGAARHGPGALKREGAKEPSAAAGVLNKENIQAANLADALPAVEATGKGGGKSATKPGGTLGVR